jgi:hypothetical protein
MRAPQGLKEDQSRRFRIRDFQLGTGRLLHVRGRPKATEVLVGEDEEQNEHNRSSNCPNHYSEATFARRRATLRSWLCHERFCPRIWFHAPSSLWRSGSNGRRRTANYWLRYFRTGSPATTFRGGDVGIHSIPLVNRILVSHAGVAAGAQGNQVVQNSGTSARLGDVVSHVKIKYCDRIATPRSHAFVGKCGTAMADPHLLTQGLGDLLLHTDLLRTT